MFVPYPATWLRAGSFDDEEIADYLEKAKEPAKIRINYGEPGWTAWVAHKVAESDNPMAADLYREEGKIQYIFVPSQYPPTN